MSSPAIGQSIVVHLYLRVRAARRAHHACGVTYGPDHPITLMAAARVAEAWNALCSTTKLLNEHP